MISQSYTSFSEKWSVATWNNNRITTGGKDYVIGADAQLIVIYVGKDVSYFNPTIAGANFKVYINAAPNATSLTKIYVILGDEVTNTAYNATTAPNGYRTYKTETAADGSTVTYYVRSVVDDLVTKVVRTDAKDYKVSIDDVYYPNIIQNGKIQMPTSTTGTGYKVTYTLPDGTQKTEYVKSATEWTVPACKDGSEIKFESGHVAWTLGDKTVPVAFQKTDVKIADELGALSGQVGQVYQGQCR